MQRIKTVIKLTLLLLMIYLLLRIIFQLRYYSAVSVGEEIKVLYWGLRLDLAAIFYTLQHSCNTVLQLAVTRKVFQPPV